jgi:glycosyltransferase involved in cell wall biosynthesis
MRILHIIASIDPKCGGTSTVCRELAAAQAAKGNAVSIIAYGSLTDDYAARSNVRYVELPRVGSPEQLVAWRLRSRLAEAVAAHDVCHVHGMWEGVCLEGSRACTKAKKPYVHSPHGMLDAWALSEFRLKKQVALALGFKRLPGNAGAVMVSNSHEFDCVRDTGLAKRIEFIPHGIDIAALDRGMAAGTKTGGELCGVGTLPYILFVGRIHEQKGLELLVRTFATVSADYPNHRLVMTGPDFGEKDLLVRLAASLNISEKVILPGALYAGDKACAFRDCAFFITLTKHENFGMTLAEAMTCRCAVIASKECYFQEIVPAGAGIEVPRDVTEAAAAMRKLLLDPAGTKAMGEKGRALVETTFVWPAVADRFSTLFTKLQSGT